MSLTLSVYSNKHFKCKSLLTNLEGAVVLGDYIVGSKVVSLRHTDAVVNSFGALFNVRDNYMKDNSGVYVTASKEGGLSRAIEANLNYGSEELRNLALNNNLDYLHLTFMYKANTYVHDNIDHLIYANFGRASSYYDTWEVHDTPVLSINDVTIVEAYYCSPDM